MSERFLIPLSLTHDDEPSSLPVMTKGKKRGRPPKERDGKWIYVSGVETTGGAGQRASWAAECFAKTLHSLGIRVGYTWSDDVESWYVWKPDAEKSKNLKLVVSVIDGQTYAYREDAQHFEKVEPTRLETSACVPVTKLDIECKLDTYGDDFHMVFDLSSWPDEGRK